MPAHGVHLCLDFVALMLSLKSCHLVAVGSPGNLKGQLKQLQLYPLPGVAHNTIRREVQLPGQCYQRWVCAVVTRGEGCTLWRGRGGMGPSPGPECPVALQQCPSEAGLGRTIPRNA